jgi:hypothetical protein
MAYADDIIVVSRSLTAMKETYNEIKTIEKTTGLEVNVHKTKMLIQTRRNQRQTGETDMEGDEIETVDQNFIKNGEDYREITRRIKLANNAYFSLLSVFRSKDIHRANKIKIYKTMTRPVLYYGCEDRTLNKKEELAINFFERKILRQIYEPMKENEIWRIRYNKELYELYKEPEIFNFNLFIFILFIFYLFIFSISNLSNDEAKKIPMGWARTENKERTHSKENIV